MDEGGGGFIERVFSEGILLNTVLLLPLDFHVLLGGFSLEISFLF